MERALGAAKRFLMGNAPMQGWAADMVGMQRRDIQGPKAGIARHTAYPHTARSWLDLSLAA